MNPRIVLQVLVAFLVISSPLLTASAGSHRSASEAEFEQLAVRFREYRHQLREDTDRQRPELRDWNGPVHEVMSEVGKRVETKHLSPEVVKGLLGKPDEVFVGGSHHNGKTVPHGERHLVYWWRGGHDYLYLIARHGQVVRSAWWFAGE